MADNNDKKIGCYVCDTNLKEEYKKEIIQYSDSDHFFKKICVGMIRWDGVKKLLCVSCYKNHLSGIKIYQEKNPNWEPPQQKGEVILE